jgi:HemK-like putative methylase
MSDTLMPTALSFLEWWKRVYAPLDLSPEQRREELLRWITFLDLPSYETLAYLMTPQEAHRAVAAVWEQWDPLLQKRLGERVPIQYLLGTTTFLGLNLQVRPPCLIPRPETELLCEAVVTWLGEKIQQGALDTVNKPPTIWEVGVGTGCISLGIHHLLHEKGIMATYVGGDVCRHALALAFENATTHGVALSLFESDLLQGFPTILPLPDVVVTNLPYIDPALRERLAPEVLAHEGHHTLFAEEAGFALIYQLISTVTVRFGKTWRGVVALEFGDGMHGALGEHLTAEGFIHQQWIRDYHGTVRHVLASR